MSSLRQLAVSDLQRQLLLVFLGFVLTTVLGGSLTFWYQGRRAKVDLREKEREVARAVFEELSRLMDKRTYRMMQVGWSLDPEDADEDTLRNKMADYRLVLYEWNDSLNRNLALTCRYFGANVLEQLECNVAERFAGAHQELVAHYRVRMGSSSKDPTLSLTAVNQYLRDLGDHVYNLNEQMLHVIGERRYTPRAEPRRPCLETRTGRRRDLLLLKFKESLNTG